jgi:hypothetical protein
MAANDISSPSEPMKQEWDDLIQDVKSQLLSEMGTESWYLLIATVLTVGPRPHLLASFWTHIISQDPVFSSSEAQTRLSERLRDLLLKQMTLVGAPQLLSAMIPLAKVQAEGKPEIIEEGVQQKGEMDLSQWSVPVTCSTPSSLH